MEQRNAQSLDVTVPAQPVGTPVVVPIVVTTEITDPERIVVDTDFVATNGKPVKTPKLSFAGPGAAAAGSLDDDVSAPDSAVANRESVGVLDAVPLDAPEEPEIIAPKKPISRRRLYGLAVLVVGIFAALVLGIRLENSKSNAQNASAVSPSDRIASQQVPLATLAHELGPLAQAPSGSITVNGSVVLAPTLQPSNPLPGELYYDQASKKMQYYDGAGFVPLQGGNVINNNYSNIFNSTNVTNNFATNITNVTNVTAGAALSGTPNTLAMFDSTGQAVADSILSQSGTSLVTAATTILGTDASGLILTTASSATGPSGDVTLDVGSGLITGEVVGNKTFEGGTDNMQNWFGDTIAQSCTIDHSGSCSLAVTLNSAFWGISDQANPGSMAPVIAGHHYYFTAWVKAATTGRAIAGYMCWNNDTCDDVPLTTVTDSTTAWTEITGTAVAPGGATTVSWSFNASTGGAGEVHYFDDLVVTDLSASSSASTLNLGTTNAQFVNIGNMDEVGPTTIDGGSGIALYSGAGPISVNGGAITISGTAASSLSTTSGSLVLASGGGLDGGVIVSTQADSTSAFTVQGADSGVTMLNVDTTNNTISLGVGAGNSFGYTSNGNNQSSAIPAGQLKAYPYTTTTTGILKSISVRVFSQDVAPNNRYQLAVYSDSSGSPGAYLGSTAVGTLSTSVGTQWYTLPLVAPVSVTANTVYWLVYWENGNDNTLMYTAGTSTTGDSSTSTWQGGPDNGLPATFPSGSVGGDALHSIYATYTTNNPALTINSSGLLTQSGAAIFRDPTTSTTAFQVQDSIGTQVLVVNTADSVVNITNLGVSGHIITSGTTPAIAAGAAACTTPTVSVAGNDTAGTITIRAGTGCSGGGSLATITFAKAFGVAPRVMLTPGSPVSQTLGAYIDDSTASATSFVIGANTAPTSSQTYKWNYFVIQ